MYLFRVKEKVTQDDWKSATITESFYVAETTQQVLDAIALDLKSENIEVTEVVNLAPVLGVLGNLKDVSKPAGWGAEPGPFNPKGRSWFPKLARAIREHVLNRNPDAKVNEEALISLMNAHDRQYVAIFTSNA